MDHEVPIDLDNAVAVTLPKFTGSGDYISRLHGLMRALDAATSTETVEIALADWVVCALGCDSGLLLTLSGDRSRISVWQIAGSNDIASTKQDHIFISDYNSSLTRFDTAQRLSVSPSVFADFDLFIAKYPEFSNVKAVLEKSEDNGCLNHSFLVAPMISDQRYGGVICLTPFDAVELTYDALAFISTAASLVSRCLGRVRSTAYEHAMSEQLLGTRDVACLGSWSLNLSDLSLYWSPEMFRLAGFDPANGIPPYEDFLSRIHQDDLPKRDAAIAKFEHDGIPCQFSMRFLLPDENKVRWVVVSCRNEWDPEGRAVRRIGTLTDITALKEAEEDAARLTAIVECASDYVVTFNLDGTVLYCNKSLKDLLGIEAALPHGFRLSDVHTNAAWAGIGKQHALRVVLATGSWRGESVYRTASGGETAVSMHVVLHRDSNGSPAYLSAISRDIREQKRAELELKHLAAQLEEAQATAKLGSWEHDIITGRTYWSTENFRVLEFEPENGIPDMVEIAARFGPGEPLLRNVMHSLPPGTTNFYNRDSTLQLPDGREKWIHRKGRIEYDSKGGVVRIHGVNMDVTERKLAEQELQRTRAIIETTSDYVSTSTMDGRIVSGNKAMRDLLGLDEIEPLTMRFDPLYTPESLQRVIEVVRPTVAATGHWIGELDITVKDGIIIPLSVNIFVHHDVQGKQLYRSAICRDISDQRRYAQEQRHAQMHLEAAQREAKLGSWELDVATGQLWFSREYYRIIDRNPDNPIPDLSVVYSLYSPEDANTFKRAIIAAIHKGEPYDITLSRLDQNGATRYYRGIGTPISDEAGNVATLIHTCMDITASRQLELQLFQSQKMESIGRFAGAIAHDFNNLLSVVMGHADLLAEMLEDNPECISSIESIQAAAESGASLTKNLVAFSRKQHIAPSSVEPCAVINGLTSMLSPLMGRKINLITKCKPEAGSVWIDPNQLEQVIINLVVNARDAMPNGGTVRIEVESVRIGPDSNNAAVPAGDYVLLSVIDTGEGMTAEVKERLFEPFFTTKEKGKGTGLGLATVYGIVTQNQGYILVDSELGEGTRFSIYLPPIHSANDCQDSSESS